MSNPYRGSSAFSHVRIGNGRSRHGPREPARTSGGPPRARPFPWHEVMALGLGVLRLSPAHFWSMTPREIAVALDGLLGRDRTASSLTRHDLANLVARFPD